VKEKLMSKFINISSIRGNMQIETIAAGILFSCLVCFFTVNLHNILWFRKSRLKKNAHIEIHHPSNFSLGLAAFGTLTYALEVLLYLALALLGFINALRDFPLNIKGLYMFNFQIFGIVLSIMGYVLFVWSVMVRGRYAVSWEMHENHKLVTSGPYRYVRHPSYLGYFFMFIGLFFLWPSIITLLPFIAIPGYFLVTFDEEKLLVDRFGQDYEEYIKKTGRFIPKFQKHIGKNKDSLGDANLG
jgi:protein-S-isoprenylcysteine O-methyltransferase Ste14